MATSPTPKNRGIAPHLAVVTGLIALAVSMRLVVHFLPGLIPYNFTPVEAIALFGGASFANRRLAIVAPLVAMLLADLVIGLHPLIPVVYGCIAVTALAGRGLARRAGIGRLALFGAASATFFFIVTNFAVWLTSGMYPLTGAGLVACYVAGLPFYPATLAGTLFWTGALFGTLALLRQRWPVLATQSATA